MWCSYGFYAVFLGDHPYAHDLFDLSRFPWELAVETAFEFTFSDFDLCCWQQPCERYYRQPSLFGNIFLMAWESLALVALNNHGPSVFTISWCHEAEDGGVLWQVVSRDHLCHGSGNLALAKFFHGFLCLQQQVSVMHSFVAIKVILSFTSPQDLWTVTQAPNRNLHHLDPFKIGSI